MHIWDALITDQPAIALAMWAISLAFLAFAWKKARQNYSRSTTALLAISSAFVFSAQIINFPIAAGTSAHLVGGTFLAILLGPYAAMLSMTIVLLMQAVFFADGGILAFGMNVFNMAIIGALSFFIVKQVAKKTSKKGTFLTGVFAASWTSVVAGAVVAGMELGLANAGGIALWVPLMFFWHALIGLAEGAITVTLVSGVQRFQPTVIGGLALLKRRGKS